MFLKVKLSLLLLFIFCFGLSPQAHSEASKIYLSATVAPFRLQSFIDHSLIPLSSIICDPIISGFYINLPKYYRNDPKTGTYPQSEIQRLQELNQSPCPSSPAQSLGPTASQDNALKSASFISGFGKKIILHPVEEDLGPITKLLPTIEKLKTSLDRLTQPESSTFIISLDDDYAYPEVMLRSLIDIQRRLRGSIHHAALGYSVHSLNHWIGLNQFYYRFPRNPLTEPFEYSHWISEFDLKLSPSPHVSSEMKSKQTISLSYGDILEGFGLVAYRLSYFENIAQLKKMFQSSQDCRLSDDLVISYYLGLNQIKKAALSAPMDHSGKAVRAIPVQIENDESLSFGAGLNDSPNEFRRRIKEAQSILRDELKRLLKKSEITYDIENRINLIRNRLSIKILNGELPLSPEEKSFFEPQEEFHYQPIRIDSVKYKRCLELLLDKWPPSKSKPKAL